MKVTWLLLPLLLLVGLVLWWAGRGAAADDSIEARVEEVVEVVQSPQGVVPPTQAPARRLAGEPEESPEPASPAVEEEPPSAPVEELDRAERRELVIHVVDSLSNPIHSAEVRATGTRTTQNGGDWLGWLGPELAVQTDVEGRALIDYPVFYRSTGGSWRDTEDLCFTVTHPQYVAANLEAEVAPGEYRVVMKQGTLVLVSGWVDSPSNRVTDLVVRASDDTELGSDAWTETADGRWSCSAMPPGAHALLVEQERDGVVWHSEPEPFTVAEGDQLELELELRAPRRIEGQLDPAVPRPVENGGVTVHVYREEDQDDWILRRSYKAPVASDGSFSLEGVRRGAAEIIGICDGWSSTPLAGERPEPQEVPLELEGPFTLAMQPTAALEVTVLKPDGQPLDGAQVYCWPNVRWRIGYSTIFMARQWLAVTDARGLARIENLPPGEGESLVVIAGGYQMPMAESPWGLERRNAWTDFISGETAEVEVTLEPAED